MSQPHLYHHLSSAACTSLQTILLVTHSEIDGDDVAEPLLVVEEGGEVGDQDDQHRWHIDRHEVAEDRPLEHDLNLAERFLGFQ